MQTTKKIHYRYWVWLYCDFMVSLVAAINNHATNHWITLNLLTFLSPATLLNSWINTTFSDIALVQRLKMPFHTSLNRSKFSDENHRSLFFFLLSWKWNARWKVDYRHYDWLSLQFFLLQIIMFFTAKYSEWYRLCQNLAINALKHLMD